MINHAENQFGGYFYYAILFYSFLMYFFILSSKNPCSGLLAL